MAKKEDVAYSLLLELEGNLKEGGDGFGIRDRFNINRITQDDIREISRNTAADYGYSEKRIRKMLQDIGVRPTNMRGIDLAAELKGIADDDALGNAGNRGQGLGAESAGHDNAHREHSTENQGGGARYRKVGAGGIDGKASANDAAFPKTPIKKEYKGKLIFAQSGTGKTTIADNVSVIDSDYL